jgi:repressor LexA
MNNFDETPIVYCKSGLSDRDERYLEKLRDYYKEHHVLPSFTRFSCLIGLRSSSSVVSAVSRMKASGYIDSTPEHHLQPGKKFFDRPRVKVVAHNSRQQHYEIYTDPGNIDEELVSNPSQTILVTVQDNAMVEAGILPGDVAVVEKGASAQPGNLVAVVIERELTIRILEEDANGLFLRAANLSFPKIQCQESLVVLGVVAGLFRKYYRE